METFKSKKLLPIIKSKVNLHLHEKKVQQK